METVVRFGSVERDGALLLLPGVIADLVLGWDFLVSMGTVLECPGLKLEAGPRNPQEQEQLEDRLSVAVAGTPVNTTTPEESTPNHPTKEASCHRRAHTVLQSS